MLYGELLYIQARKYQGYWDVGCRIGTRALGKFTDNCLGSNSRTLVDALVSVPC